MEIAGELGAKVAVEAAMAIGMEAGKMSAMNTGLGIGREVGRVAGAQAAAVAAAKDLAKMNMAEITQVENKLSDKRSFRIYWGYRLSPRLGVTCFVMFYVEDCLPWRKYRDS